MSGLVLHQEPEGAFRLAAPLGDAETFDHMDPVRLVSQQLSDAVLTTDTALLANGVVGFAMERAEGINATSRSTSTANGFGAAENSDRTYIPWDAPGLQIRTRNYWTTAGTQIAKAGTLIGTIKHLSPFTGSIWGVDATAVTEGDAGELNATDSALILITAVLDNNMIRINADATLTAGEGWIVFKPVGASSQMRHGGV